MQSTLAMMQRRTAFLSVSNRLYSLRVGSHSIVNLARGCGVALSTKTVIKSAKEDGIRGKSTWARRLGKAKCVSWGRPIWKTITSGHLPVQIAQAFCAWWNYYASGGRFDIEAVIKGERPP
jgi:hypothetical protein